MNILLVGQFIEPPFAEGVTNVILNWSRALAKARVDIQILSLSSKHSGHHQILGIDFEYLRTNNPRFQSTLPDLFALQREVIKISKGFDIVHYALNADSVSSLPSLLITKLDRCKKVNSYHADHLAKSTYLLRNLLFDAFTVPSRRMLNHFKQKIPSRKIRAIPPCVDTELFKPRDKTQARKKLGLPEDDFLIFTIGHFKRGRRLIPLIRTVEKLANKRNDIKLLLGWTGLGESDNIKEAFATLEKREFVRLIRPTDRIHLYYNAADVYVLSATSSSVIEMPMSAIEALSSNVPTVTFNINAVSEIIVNDVNGYLVEDGDFSKMQSALTHLIENRHLLRELPKKARNEILNQFSYETIGNQLRTFYSELMGL